MSEVPDESETTVLWNDAARIASTLDANGNIVATRAYTDEENEEVEARQRAEDDVKAAIWVAKTEQAAVHNETRDRVRAIIDDLQAEKARVQPTIDASNATINANPAGYIKDNARAIKRIADATIDLAKFVDGR